jgi:glycosyltransferase involved in cell wall biosynthesis
MTLISIVIPNYNYAHFLERLFGSLASQNFPLEQAEIIFVDDGSTDNSIEKAYSWTDRLNCSEFRIISADHCGKPGIVRNRGLFESRGKYLLTLDPDDSLEPEYISSCVEVLEKDNSADLVYTNYYKQSSAGRKELLLPDFSAADMRSQNLLPPTAIYRREYFNMGARYRDNTLYEDWDYWIQLLMLGAKFHHIRKPLYNYLVHENSFSAAAVKDDGPSKAKIVLNNPDFFNNTVRTWASDHLRNRNYAPSFQRGIIPRPQDITRLLMTIEKM